MPIVHFNGGIYRNGRFEVNMDGVSAPLSKDYRVGTRGGYITVNTTEVPGFPDRNIRIFCDQEEYYITGENQLMSEQVTKDNHADGGADDRTDEEIMEYMRQRFAMLTEMTKAVKRGDIRAMIVSGPPGVGKSHGVEQVLDEYKLLEQDIGGLEPKYEIVKGEISALGLYCKLYQYSARDNVLVFDDCDVIFEEPSALNILKAALDSKRDRKINWNTDSRKLREDDIPNSFSFKGGCIFITNVKFDHVRSKKLRDHLEALESRCHYVDLGIDTDRERMLRIRQVTRDGMLDVYGFTDDQIDDILEYVDVNKHRLRDLSLRTVIKIADLMKAFPDYWAAHAENSVIKRGK